MERHLLPHSLLNIEKADGIIEFSTDHLAFDPSLILGYPHPPGSNYFYVDNLFEIQAGCKIFYSTEAENNPQIIRQSLVDLHKARRELAKYPPAATLYRYWQLEVAKCERSVTQFYQGRKLIKSLRIVSMVDRSRHLIVVREPFAEGYKPKVMGFVVRITGFESDQIDEQATDRFHKKAKEELGYDWENIIREQRINSHSPA